MKSNKTQVDINTERPGVDLNFNSLYKRLTICIMLGIVITIWSAFSIMKIGMAYRDERIIKLKNQLDTYDIKLQSALASIDEIKTSLESVQTEMKSNKDSSSYSLVRLASLLKDVQKIKEALHINSESLEDSIKQLPSDKRDFIETFENLIKDGVPFNSFLESNTDKINMDKYAASKSILKFKDINAKSIEALKKDFVAIGTSVFGASDNESFWTKQLRIFKEKFFNAVRIESSNEANQDLGNNLDDKVLFEKAQGYINDGKSKEALEVLNKIKTDNQDILTLKSELSTRIELDDVFQKFKREFTEAEISTIK